MPALFLTAAEVAAAEAAAIAAAEAAAVHAAQVAAAQAAQVAAAEAATQAAATAAAEQAAAATTQTATSGIQTLAQEVATTTPPTGVEQLTQAFQNVNPPPMSQAEFLNNSLAGANTPFNPVTGATTPLSPLTPATPALPPMAPPAVPNAPVPAPMTYFDATQPFANPTYASAAPPALPAAPTSPAAPQLDYGFNRPDMGGAGGVQQGVGGTGMQAQLTPEQLAGPNQYSVTNGLNYQSPISASINTPPTPEPSGIESLFNKGLDYVQKNPLTALMGANTAYNALNKPKPEEKKKYQSTFKSNLYSGYTPVQPTPYQPQYAVGGLADLGGYSDGGRMLKGPGDGMSDDIPATIAGKQPARLANEEFVIPADVVSHLGNGSSEAGAKQLYKMMDRIRKARTGTKKQGKQINPEKYLA